MPYVLAIVPTIGVGVLFYFVIKSILEGDRRERLAQARWEAEHDRAGTPSAPGAARPGTAPTGVEPGPGTDTDGTPAGDR